jgi:Cdc6-like AAA superfamily ATPase
MTWVGPSSRPSAPSAPTPLREEAHQELIRLHAAAGQPSAAHRQYRELERILQKEFGIAPSAATRRLVASLEPRASPSALLGLESAVSSLPGSPAHRGSVISALAAGVDHSPAPEAVRAVRVVPAAEWEPVGGAVPLGSSFYVTRPVDEQFAAALARQDSIVLVKGPRGVGKTSLLARGLDRARQAGARVVLTDFATFNAVHLQSAEALLLALAQSVADQLDLDVSPMSGWEAHRGPNPNYRRYLRREVLSAIAAPVVWGLDEVDRLFGCEFSGEIFSMFRSWHNERALDPTSPWARLTLAMAYATEAHLFITDLNKSPFNVGTHLALDDLTLEQTADLNRRYGSPLKGAEEVSRYYRLVGGHPDLVRHGLHHLATSGMALTAFAARADRDDGVFGDHLQRMLDLLLRDPELCEVVRAVLSGRPCAAPRSFYRLRTAGLLSGDSEADARPRCQLYAAYLERHLL